MISRVDNERIFAMTRFVFEHGERDGRLMAVAVTNEAGQLVYGASMELANARILTHSIRKAYTAAVMQRDTITFRDEDKEMEKTLADWGDDRLTHLVGGMVLRKGTEWYGGLGVGGNTTERDDEIARLAVDVLLGSEDSSCVTGDRGESR
jgi:uncharacterized protein GlcG (DUF336 family)